MRRKTGGSGLVLPPSAVPATGVRTEVTVDPVGRVLKVQQWPSPLMLEPQTVLIPFDEIITLAAQAVLVDAGVLKVGVATPEGAVQQAERALQAAGVVVGTIGG